MTLACKNPGAVTDDWQCVRAITVASPGGDGNGGWLIAAEGENMQKNSLKGPLEATRGVGAQFLSAFRWDVRELVPLF